MNEHNQSILSRTIDERDAAIQRLANLEFSMRALAHSWRVQNGDYPESKDDCADEMLALIAAPDIEP